MNDAANAVSQLLEELGITSSPTFTSVGGGSINDAWSISVDGQRFFCKVNSASKFPQLFEKEKEGLQYMARQCVIQTAEAIGITTVGDTQCLLLKWIASGERTAAFWKSFGAQLAALHAVTNARFGFETDNYMGSIVQHNDWHTNWVDFFTGQRLMPLVAQCSQQNLLPPQLCAAFESLYTKLPLVFDETQPPALLHGDLWSGNFMCNTASGPVLIDPAVAFGHPSADLGMTTLFGGFHRSFYEAYHYHAPFPTNHQEQWQVCNLYPLLIHLLLFGNSYLPSIRATLQQFA